LRKYYEDILKILRNAEPDSNSKLLYSLILADFQGISGEESFFVNTYMVEFDYVLARLFEELCRKHEYNYKK